MRLYERFKLWMTGPPTDRDYSLDDLKQYLVKRRYGDLNTIVHRTNVGKDPELLKIIREELEKIKHVDKLGLWKFADFLALYETIEEKCDAQTA